MAESAAAAPVVAPAATKVLRTTSASLQAQFEQWGVMIGQCLAASSPEEKRQKVLEFTRSFVPVDVTADDIEHFSGNLLNDEEFFLSVQRDVQQCASGINVESISGNQQKKAVFTLLPLPEMQLDTPLDIVREVAYISSDGVKWTAEG